MSIKNPIQDVEVPFSLTPNGDGFHQTCVPIMQKRLLLRESLEKIIGDTILHENFDSIGIRSVLAEKLALYILENDFSIRYKNNPDLEIKVIEGKPGYLINSSEKYHAKLESSNRIVILENDKKSRDDEDKKTKDSKFGYRGISEIDGLVMLKQRKKPKNQKRFIAIESKTGNIDLEPAHIVDNVIRPLEIMYEHPVHYMLIGFKDRLYANSQTNKLHKNVEKFYTSLPQGIRDKCHIVHFPFSRLEFVTKFNALEDYFAKQIRGNATYDIKSGVVTIKTPLGEVIDLKVDQDKTL